MPVIQKFVYEAPFNEIKSSEDIIALLNDIENSLSLIDPNLKKSLRQSLIFAERGRYRSTEKTRKELDLRVAKELIESYRESSEGGCKSCINLGTETICAEDAEVGFYCEVTDPDFDKNATGLGVRYSGFSPKVSRHYESPCAKWDPRFKKTIEQLLKENGE
jgi:fructose-1,6-bisphosphatase